MSSAPTPERETSDPVEEAVKVKLSRGAAAFLLGTVRHLNQVKLLPQDDRQAALESSAWLEEIEAMTARALLSPGGDR